MRRMNENEEITNAGVRRAMFKANEKIVQSSADISSATYVLSTYNNTVERIEKEANDRYEEITAHEENLKKQSKAPKFSKTRT